MKKDAYYFPHDSNATEDPKMMLLIDELGMEGYGIFWMLLEALRNQKGVYLITDTSNGKMYVGSAYGDEMILNRC